MDISSLLERTPPSPASDNASATSHGSQNGVANHGKNEPDSYTQALPSMQCHVLQPPFVPQQPSYQSMASRFRQPSYSQPPYPSAVASYHAQTQSHGQLPPVLPHERRASIPSIQMNMPPSTISALPNKRLAPTGAHPAESPAKKKQSKWSGEEDAAIIELRGNGMKWEDISKHLPGRSAISCRLRFQNYLERRSEWDDEKKNKLARLYERFKKDMWEKIAKEMQLPWRAAEAMHWQIGEVEMASRANVPVFHLANTSSSSEKSSQSHRESQVQTCATPASIAITENGSANGSISPLGPNMSINGHTSTHNHTLPQMTLPPSPGHSSSRRLSTSSTVGADSRNRADSARESSTIRSSNSLEPGRRHASKRYVSPFPDRKIDIESN